MNSSVGIPQVISMDSIQLSCSFLKDLQFFGDWTKVKICMLPMAFSPYAPVVGVTASPRRRGLGRSFPSLRILGEDGPAICSGLCGPTAGLAWSTSHEPLRGPRWVPGIALPPPGRLEAFVRGQF